MANIAGSVGKVFGRLTVLAEFREPGKRMVMRCRCSCGNEKLIRGSHVTSGATTSCGCLSVEKARERIRLGIPFKNDDLHTKLPEYAIWCGVKQRCYNPRARHYNNYGGRGIAIHPPWREAFSAFYADVGSRPGPDYQLDRINNDGNYEPGNCRWATRSQQMLNRRNNARVLHNGELRSISEWAKITGIPDSTIWKRLQDKTLSINEVFSPQRRRMGPKPKR